MTALDDIKSLGTVCEVVLLLSFARVLSLSFRHIKKYIKQLTDEAKKSDALTLIKDDKMYPSCKYIMSEAEEINQIATTVNMIRLFVTVLRYVLGFLTDKYLSNAKLTMVKADAVLELKKLLSSTVNSSLRGFFPKYKPK